MVTNRARQGIILIAPKKFETLLRRLAPLTFLIWVQAFRDPLRGELPHVQIFMNDGPDPTRSLEMPSCSDIDLAEIRRSSKISSWIWSIISGVVTVLCRPRRGASQVEKSPRLNRATQLLTVAYDGACSPNISAEWREFPSAPCLARKKKLTARISVLLKSRASPDLLPFSLYNKKRLAIRHMNRPLFPKTIDSVLRHREVGRAKDLLAPLRSVVAIL